MTNTLSIPRSGKLAILATALVYTGLSFGIATGAAPLNAAGTPYYSATLAAPASEARTVAGGVAWSCEDTTCVGSKASARPLRICRSLNHKFGEVAAFKVLGQPITEDELAQCNS